MARIRRALVTSAAIIALCGPAGCTGAAGPDAPTAGTSTPGPESTETASTGAASVASVGSAVEERVAAYDGIVTGVIALVRVGDETEVVTGGQADAGKGRATEPDLTFPIASVTKPMTATLAMQLVEEGLLQLDDPVQEWLPELRPIDAPVTVEQLLSHRSGVPDTNQAEFEHLDLAETGKLLEAAAGRGLDFPPGAEGRYSNLGYAALGLVVERILQQPLAEAFEERVFGPAGMESATLGGSPDVQGYTDAKPVQDYHLEFVPAAGSVVAPAADVDAFFQALWAGELVRDDSVATMRRPRGTVTVDETWRPDYGLGLMHDEVSCGLTLGHTGALDGFVIHAWTLEDGTRSTVVMVNELSAGVAGIARSIVEGALCD